MAAYRRQVDEQKCVLKYNRTFPCFLRAFFLWFTSSFPHTASLSICCLSYISVVWSRPRMSSEYGVPRVKQGSCSPLSLLCHEFVRILSQLVTEVTEHCLLADVITYCDGHLWCPPPAAATGRCGRIDSKNTQGNLRSSQSGCSHGPQHGWDGGEEEMVSASNVPYRWPASCSTHLALHCTGRSERQTGGPTLTTMGQCYAPNVSSRL